MNKAVTCPQDTAKFLAMQTALDKASIPPYTTLSTEPKVYGGVAATLLLHAPAWFQRRYTMMIQNTVANIPDDWVVQIFYTAVGQSKKGTGE